MSGLPSSAPLHLERVESHVLRAPVTAPVRNSFRTLHAREALLVRVCDQDGAWGWGEIWCNYPPGAAAHRARLVDEFFAPLLAGRRFDGPAQAFAELERAARVPALQCGELGPYAQVIGGIDVALWDLAARRAGEPLWRWLAGSSRVKAYASGIGPDRPEAIVGAKLAEGYRAVKMKVGFGDAVDQRNVRAVREVLGSGGELMLDANQRWEVADATAAANRLAEYEPVWLEEPIAADEPVEAWAALAAAVSVPLAAGENLRGLAAFTALIESRTVRYIQPDAGKWGGCSGGLAVARRAAREGCTFCPHWLGGGVGLMASLHLLAASGGAGWAEIDANANPLRTDFLPADWSVRDGEIALGTAPGIGVEPDAEAIERYRAR